MCLLHKTKFQGARPDLLQMFEFRFLVNLYWSGRAINTAIALPSINRDIIPEIIYEEQITWEKHGIPHKSFPFFIGRSTLAYFDVHMYIPR